MLGAKTMLKVGYKVVKCISIVGLVLIHNILELTTTQFATKLC